MFYWALGGAQVARFHGNTVILHLYSNCAMDLDRGPPLRPRVGLRTSPDWDTPPRRRQRGRLRVFLSAGGRMRRRRIVHLGLWRPARLCLWWSSTMLRARRGLPGRAVRGRLRQCRPVQWHLLRRIPESVSMGRAWRPASRLLADAVPRTSSAVPKAKFASRARASLPRGRAASAKIAPSTSYASRASASAFHGMTLRSVNSALP